MKEKTAVPSAIIENPSGAAMSSELEERVDIRLWEGERGVRVCSQQCGSQQPVFRWEGGQGRICRNVFYSVRLVVECQRMAS